MRYSLLTIATFISALAATTGHAQNGLGRDPSDLTILSRKFDVADRNHDGRLTREEASNGPVEFIRENFDAIDKNHLGYVTKQDVLEYINSTQHPAPATTR
jgi:Ca2+-binding EF-hand superfamily protein